MPVSTSTMREQDSLLAQSRTANGKAGLKQMRKGTKSCLECRRRKIKCNYTPQSGDDSSVSANSSTVLTSPALDVRPKCIECHTHNRQCEIQGLVAQEPEPPTSLDSTSKDKQGHLISKRIYKRRRDVRDPESEEGQPHSSSPQGSRMKIHVNRMDSVVERLARERDGPWQPNSTLGLFTDIADSVSSDMNVSLHTKQSCAPMSGSSVSEILSPPSYNAGSRSCGKPSSMIPGEDQAKKTSPLLTQLFNNEMLSQSSVSPAILTEKVQVLTFSDSRSNLDSATDVEKLRSSIESEPYLLKALDLSTHWWVAWRDQTYALHEVFLKTRTPPASAESSSDIDTNSNSGTPDDNETWPHKEIKPVSLRDFVRAKLSEDDAVSVATGLLCIAMSLRDLRPGIDDIELNISTTPAELADRIVLAVDMVLLSPTSNPVYMKNPGMLLLYMMRAKIYAEANQLRKSWLSIRKAIEVARESGFADALPFQEDGEMPVMNEVEASNILHRQRWIGSLLELDRLMSMVLGFPHAEDDKFSDRLALNVLRGQGLASTNEDQGVSLELRMRAFRRVVAVIAGRVNDRNANPEPEDAMLHTTMCIQASLDEVAAAMPTSWWNVTSHLANPDPYVTYQHLMAQMWFWQVQSFLNLPYMMKPSPHARPQSLDDDGITSGIATDPYETNRYLCLQGCRGMLRIFHLLRFDPSLAVYICPCEDFQGVFSACILMVGLLIRLSFCPHAHAPSPVAAEKITEDLDLIEQVKDIFRYRAMHLGGHISKQGVKVLDDLGGFLEDYSAGVEPKKRTVVLPYFGAIYLELRPPQYLRERAQEVGLEVLKPAQPTMQATLPDFPVHGDFDLQYRDIQETKVGLDSQSFDDTSFQIPVPDATVDWDQFLFGEELDRNWDLVIPEWPQDSEAFDLG
ncbi:hypothetical protein LTR99_009889 [Exophiala xenobiotica]|uniref:Zn(2)-C6 fungal-type domain-containing protein n=1 Tax=Vermiconidia calcicola TaxID=1690605 RepID=A0AAV9QBH7_9PEZI|nr:hypothetical protein LTR41_009663 [Exophiala xenobiotica]KAK5533186.1 hypothetical protein LTR23_009292 [Chaetothyriales sp. CCFEE 6169]KAK5536809.1 hypothetical protein LTR25_005483 [Vermiconidia calcicola]KAK5216761.1 hypothetical protein LTR72_010131 [Exophiala xenobiotica]KAK5264524.1 hypothetical protein LTR96_010004 [Exophiala xenobiotica]